MRSNLYGEASKSEPASRSASESDSAPLRKAQMVLVNRPDVVKAETGEEQTDVGPPEHSGAQTPGDRMREPVTKAFRRAGCGKSACPVRRGDGGSRIHSVAPRPTLPAIFLHSFSGSGCRDGNSYSLTEPKEHPGRLWKGHKFAAAGAADIDGWRPLAWPPSMLP